jgi:ribosomal subunit interface protein
MKVQVSGQRIDVGDALRSHVTARLNASVAKYFDNPIDGAVTFARDGNDYRSECAVHLKSGITLHAQGRSPDIYASYDMAVDRMETRLRRYKSRLKGHHNHAQGAVQSSPAQSYVIAAEEEGQEEPKTLEPLIIAEASSEVRTWTVGEAVMQLNLAEAPALLFRNSAHGGLNVVYRRPDGNVGWIDPSFDPKRK